MTLPFPPLFPALLTHPEGLAKLDLATWDRLLPLAYHTGTTGRFYDQLAAHQALDRVPAPVLPHLQSAKMLADHHRRVVGWEIDRLRRVLGDLPAPLPELPAPVVLLKGAAYVAADLACARGRLVSDVDILVPEALLDAVEERLRDQGWVDLKDHPYDQRYYRAWMHELPPLIHRQRGTILDVHHRLLPRTSPLTSEATPLLAAARPLATQPGIAVLQPVDLVIHSAVHAFWGSELQTPWRDLLDLHELLTEFGDEAAFWPALTQRARELGLTQPLYYGLRATARLMGTSVPTAAREALPSPSPLAVRAMDWALAATAWPERPRWDTAPAAGWLYLRSHLVRMPPGLLLRHLIAKGSRQWFCPEGKNRLRPQRSNGH